MKKHKLIFALTIIALIALLLTSCFIVFHDPDEETAAVTEPPETESPFLPVETIDHRNYVEEALDAAVEDVKRDLEALAAEEHDSLPVTVTCITGKKLFVPEDDGSSYSRAVTLRNELLKSCIGTDIIVQERELDVMLNEAKAAKNAGVYYTDLVCLPQNEISSLIGQKMLMNLKTLYNSDFSGKWFDSYSNDQLSAGDFSYAVVGCGVFCGDNVYCVYFNKDIASVYPDLYAAVDSGEWTFDYMYTYASQVTSREEGVYGFGYGADNATFANVCFNATGLSYVDTSFGRTPTLKDDSDTVDSFVGTVKKLLSFEGNVCVPGSGDEARTAFTENRLLFYIDKLSEASELNNNFGILPVPKYFGEGGYTTYVDEFAPVLAALNSNNTLERTGQFLQSFNAAAGKLLRDGYVRDALDKTVRDERSADMIEIILDNTRFEFPTVFGVRYPAIANATYNAVSQAIFGETEYSVIRSRTAANFAAEAARSFSP